MTSPSQNCQRFKPPPGDAGVTRRRRAHSTMRTKNRSRVREAPAPGGIPSPTQSVRRDSGRKHPLENPLQGHGMAAHTASQEEVTIAFPLTHRELDRVRVVLPVKGRPKCLKADALTLLRVALRLLDLADHPRSPWPLLSLRGGNKKARGSPATCLSTASLFLSNCSAHGGNPSSRAPEVYRAPPFTSMDDWPTRP